jgi:hypothetical protein
MAAAGTEGPEVKKVTFQLRKPHGRDPGAVGHGWYVIRDNAVIMTDAEGNEAGMETGRRYIHRLQPGEDAHAWAVKMTKELRLAFRGSGQASVRGFDGPIPYDDVRKVCPV